MKKQMKSAFSLMEMMVVLLIISIIAAASAPMVSKKLARSTSNDNPWSYTGLVGNSIAYLPGNNSSVLIGGTKVKGNPSDKPKLYIQTSGNEAAIAFANSDANDDNLTYLTIDTREIDHDGQRLGMSNEDIQKGSVAFGTSQELSDNATSIVAIGAQAKVVRDGCTAIGFDAIAGSDTDYTKEEGGTVKGLQATAVGFSTLAESWLSTALGSGAQATKIGATSVGYGTHATENYSVAVGYKASSNAEAAAAVGAGALAKSNYSVAYGKEAKVLDNNASGVAIGTGAQIGGSSLSSADYNNQYGVTVKYTYKGGPKNNLNNVEKHDYYTHYIWALTDAAARTEALTKANPATSNRHEKTGKRKVTSSWVNQPSYASTSAVTNNGEGSIAIGHNSKAGGYHATAIGAGAIANGSHRIVLGTVDDTVYIPGNLYVKGGVLATGGFRDNVSIGGGGADSIINSWLSSDRRLKNVGDKFVGGLEELKKLDLYHFTFKKDEKKTPHVGVMAQDLQKVFPDAVTEGEDGYLRIRWDEMFYAVINAVKELDAKITELAAQVKSSIDIVTKQQATIEAQQKTIDILVKQNAEFEKRLAKLENKGVNKGVNKEVKNTKADKKVKKAEE